MTRRVTPVRTVGTTPTGGSTAGISSAVVSAAYPQTYYVDAINGLDANPGNILSMPWKTMGKVNGATFNAGDTVAFARGTGQYFNDSALIPPTRLNFTTYGSSTALAPILGMAKNYAGSTSDWSEFGSGLGIWKRTVTAHGARPMRVSLDRERAPDRVGSSAEVGVEIKGVAGTTFTGDTVSITANRTSGSPNLAVTAGLTQAQLDVIDGATISGTGIPSGTTISSHTGTIAGADAVLVMSANATSGSGTATTVTTNRIFNCSKSLATWADDVVGAVITGSNISTAHAQIFLTSQSTANATATLTTGARAGAINTAAATGTTYTLTVWTQQGTGDVWTRYILWATGRNVFQLSYQGAKPVEPFMREDDIVHYGSNGNFWTGRQNNSVRISVKSSTGSPTGLTSLLASAGHFPDVLSGSFPNDTFDLYVFEPRGNPATYRTEVICGSYKGAAGTSTKGLGLTSVASGSTFTGLWFGGGTASVIDVPTPSATGFDTTTGQINVSTTAVTDLVFTDCWFAWSTNFGCKPRHGCDNWLFTTTSAGGGGFIDNGQYAQQDQLGIKWGVGVDEIIRGHRVIGQRIVSTDHGAPEVLGNFYITGNGEDGVAGQAHSGTKITLRWVTAWKNGENGTDIKSNMHFVYEFCTLRTGGHLIGGAGVGGAAIQAYCHAEFYDSECSQIAGRHDASAGGSGGFGIQSTPRAFVDFVRSTAFCDSNPAATWGDDVGTLGKKDGWARCYSSLFVSTRNAATLEAVRVVAGDMEMRNCTVHKRATAASGDAIKIDPTRNESGVAQQVINVKNSELMSDTSGTGYLINRSAAAASTGIVVTATDNIWHYPVTVPTNWVREKSDSPAFYTEAQVNTGGSSGTYLTITHNKLAGGDPTIFSAANNPWAGGASHVGDYEKGGDLYIIGYSGGTIPQQGEMIKGQSSGAIGWVRQAFATYCVISRGSASGDYGTPGYRKVPGNTTSFTNAENIRGSFGANTTCSTTAITTNGHSVSCNTAYKLQVVTYASGSGGAPTDGNVMFGTTSTAVALQVAHTGTTAGVQLLLGLRSTVMASGETIGDGTFSATTSNAASLSPCRTGSRPEDPIDPYYDIMGRLMPQARFDATSASRIKYTASSLLLEARNSTDTGSAAGTPFLNGGAATFAADMDVWIVNPQNAATLPIVGFGIVASVAGDGKSMTFASTSQTAAVGGSAWGDQTNSANPFVLGARHSTGAFHVP